MFSDQIFRALLFTLNQKHKLKAHCNKFFSQNVGAKDFTVEEMIQMYDANEENELLKKFVSCSPKLEGSSAKLAEYQNKCKSLIDQYGFMTGFTTITFP